jgi:hypothetical protein
MAGALAAIIGLAGGGAMAYAGQKHAERMRTERQMRDLRQQMYLQFAEQNPQIINDPEFNKGASKVFGKEEWDLVTPSLKALNAAKARDLHNKAQAYRGMPGGAPYADAIEARAKQLMSADGAANSSAGPQPGGGAPSAMAATGAPKTAAPAPAAAPQPAATAPSAPPSASSTPAPASADPNDLQGRLNTYSMIAKDPAFPPEMQAQAAEQVKLLEKQIEGAQKANEPPTQYQMAELALGQQRADLEKLRIQMEARNEQATEAYRSLSLRLNDAIRLETLHSNEQFRQFTESLSQEKDEENRGRLFNSALDQLNKQHENILKLKGSNTPPKPDELRGLVNNYNQALARATTLGRRFKQDITNLPPRLNVKDIPGYKIPVIGTVGGGTEVTTEEPTKGSIESGLSDTEADIRKALNMR